jgi:hypothetical protein
MFSQIKNLFQVEKKLQRRYVIDFDEKLIPVSSDIVKIIKLYITPKCCGTTFRGKKIDCHNAGIIYPSLYGVDYMETPMCLSCEIIMKWEYDI